mmetsp:Transcript_33935/g.30695  ORF Transcript_33935/g.30695 Transcript_33935/m.30695 type:complete len:83 (-) Transcript_33935:3-251(-)
MLLFPGSRSGIEAYNINKTTQRQAVEVAVASTLGEMLDIGKLNPVKVLKVDEKGALVLGMVSRLPNVASMSEEFEGKRLPFA